MKGRRGLGRGLDALIPSSETAEAPGLQEIKINEISPNPMQPRVSLDQDALNELANSIREHGLIQPLIVTEVDDGYQLIAGERRWQAARRAGLAAVPVIVKEVTQQQTLELALVENLQREDLNPLEEAAAYRHLIEDFGLTQEEVAERVGKHRVTIANAVRLLGLPEVVKRVLVKGQITGGHARVLLSLDKKDQLHALEIILDKELSVRQTEALVRRMKERPEPSAPEADQAARQQPAGDPNTAALEEAFRDALGTKVQLQRGKKGGRLVIHFYSEEELQGLYDLLVSE